MTDSRKVQLESAVDATGARKGFSEIEAAAQRMAQGVQASGQKGAEGLAPLGDAGAGAGEKIDRATKSIIASIERTTAAMKVGERNTAAYFEALASQRGANVDALKPYLEQLRQAEVAQRTATAGLDKMGVSAGQTKAALRQLPAQFTDIVTSLQAGQAPLTVLIQQGGQIKDSFGGIVPALRAVASAIGPVAGTVAIAAAGVGALAFAWNAGRAEADAFREAVVLSGNAAGSSVAQLQAQAVAVSRVVGTQGQAAEVLAMLASTGQVAQGELGRLTEAAIRLERVGGPSIKDFAKAMADLGQDPVKASLKLNESTRYLSVAVLEQIRSLEKQGQAAAAAGVAQSAYADVAIQRSKDLEQSLGSLQKAWLVAGDAAKTAWDFFKGIGRAETVQSRLEEVTAELNRRRRAVGPDLSARSNSLIEEQGVLQSDVRLLKREADKAAAVARTTQEYEKAREANQKWADAALSNEQKIARELEVNRRNFATVNEGRRSAGLPLLDQAELNRQEAAIRKSIAGVKQLDDTLQSSREAAKQWADGYKALLKIEDDAKASALGLSKAQAELVRQVNSPGWAAASTAAKLLTVAQFQAAQAAEDWAAAEKARIKAVTDGESAQQRYLDGLDKSIDGAARDVQALNEQIAAMTLGKGAQEALAIARLDDAAAQAAQNLQAAEAQGVGEAEYERLSRLADKLAEVAAKRRELAGATAAKEVAELNEKAAKDAARDWQRTADSIKSGLTDAFRRAFESGEDFGTAFAKTIGNELKAQLAAALAGSLANGVLSLVGLAGAQGQGGQGTNAFTTASNLASLYSAGAKGYAWATGGSAAASGTLTAEFIAGYKGSSAALGGAAGAVTDGAGGAIGAGAGAGNSAAWLSTWGAAIALGVYKANQDYSAGFRRDQARDVSNSSFGGNVLGDFALGGGLESAKANLLSKLGFSDRLADLLSGSTAVAALLGYTSPQIRNAGITGSITGGDFSGNATADAVQQAGFFRKLFGGSSKTTALSTALPEEIGRFLDAGAAGILEKARAYGTALGLPVDQLGQIATAISIKADETGKLTEEALIQALSGYGDALVKGFADAVGPLATYGETTVQTIERVGGAIQGVNGVLQALGLTALQASVDGGKAAVALQELFGGIQGLQQGAGQYLQAYYSDAERAALASANLGRQLAAVGVALPATRDQFRSLVQAQDLTTDSGRQAFAVLMGVASAFAEIVPAARSAADIMAERLGLETDLLQLQGNTAQLRARELAALDPSNRSLKEMIFALEDSKSAAEQAAQAATTAAESARGLAEAWQSAAADALGGVSSAFSAVQQQAQTERQRIEAAADGDLQRLEQRAQRIKATFGGLMDSLAASVQSLTGTLAGDDGRSQAQQVLQQALRDLRAGRAINVDAVKQAASTVSRLGAEGFSTRADYQRALASTAGLLRDINTAARREMTAQLRGVASKQVDVELARDRQLAVLDQQLDQARAAAGALVSIDDGVQSMADALGRLASAIGAAQALAGGGGPTGELLRSGNTEAYRAAGGAVATRPVGDDGRNTLIRGLSGATFTAREAEAFALDRIARGDFAGLRARAVAEGIDSDALDLILGKPRGTSAAKARELGLPPFEKGTAYVSDTGPAYVHRGERIIPAGDNAALMQLLRGGGGNALMAQVLEELRALRADNLRAQAAIASHSRRTADALEGWDAVGLPPTAT